jgi:hypothetical protein
VEIVAEDYRWVMRNGVQEWLGYRQDAFGDALDIWNSGADYEQLRKRWSREPDRIEGMLVQGLAARDPLAARALQHLPLSGARAAAFVRILVASIGTDIVGFHLAAVETLHALSGDEGWSHEAVRVLLGAGFWEDRREAARVLALFQPTDDLILALSQAMGDPEYLVRQQAAATLLRYSGHESDATALPGLLDRIGGDTTAADWSSASLELAARATSYTHAH